MVQAQDKISLIITDESAQLKAYTLEQSNDKLFHASTLETKVLSADA